MKYYLAFICFLLFSILSSRDIQAQYLIKLNSDYQSELLKKSHNWVYDLNGNQLAVVPELSILDNQNIDYTIVDQDNETGKYFWVKTRFDLELNANDISQENNSQILWNDSKSAIVKIKKLKSYFEFLPRQYFLRKINFSKKLYNKIDIIYPNIELKKATNSIQSVIDSVSLDELYLTVEHLSGERSFWLNGQLDSIQTRYSYSSQIFKAKDYLQSRFEEYGYTVEYLPFSLGTFYDIQFVPSTPDHGWLITVDKIYGTHNNGLSWTLQHQGTSGGAIWSVYPFDQNIAYAVGEDGLILKTSNGSTWRELRTSINDFLFGVHFKTSTRGWICGDNGLILRTTNGGSNWSTKSTPTSNRLYDIFFINDSTGWAVGRTGTIIYTNDYGESWSLQSTPTSSRLYGVHFLDENNGFVVGWDGVVLKTTNGGTNWTSVSVPLNTRFYDIDFIDDNIGMIVGWDGACMTTIDGGASWISSGNIFQQDIYGFDLINITDAWAGGNGIVASSTNFGTNWTARLDSIPSSSLINIIATKTGTQYPDQHYIVCAHYDATSNNPMVRAPGADDNASGTAAVIEAARVLKDYNSNYSIKYILFPGEEQGLWGSEAYAANAASTGEQILGVINMDMIAYDGDNDGLVEIHAGTMANSQTIGSLMASNISAFGLSLVPDYKTSTSSTASDHSSFWDFGFPAIMHIEDFQDFNPNYHTTNDLISTLNQTYFLNNAKLTIGTLAQLAEVDTSGVDTIPEDPSIPDNFVLHEPYPNPFNPLVNIKYTINSPNMVNINIYDILGKLIKTLSSGYQGIDDYHVKWDGINDNNHQAASGIYLIKFTAGNKTVVKKVVLIR